MSQTAKCGRVRGWMADAAAGSLSESRRGEFEEHIEDCAACRAEFARMENVLGRIDQSLSAGVSVVPSPQLLAKVRQVIAAERQRAPRVWFGRNSWIAFAGACATLAALAVTVALHRSNRPLVKQVLPATIATHAPIPVSSATAHAASESRGVSRGAPEQRRRRNQLQFVLTRRSASPLSRRLNEPEVIVDPGQMQAVMQFVAEVRKGKINGAKIAEEIKASEHPIEIKPLTIAPLDESATGNNLEAPATGNHGSANARSQ